MIKSVRYPSWLVAGGIGKNHRGYSGPWNVAGADTETVHGRPLTLQFSTDGETGSVEYVKEDTILPAFIAALDKWAKWDAVNVVWFHNLEFDLTCILSAHAALLAGPRKFEVEHDGARIICFTDKTWFARVRFSDHRTVHVLDTFAYFKTSLEKMCISVGAPVRKLPKPAGLGTRRLQGPAFERYALTDACACWHVGKAIERQHAAWDLVTCVSAPQFAARVLRHKYFSEGEKVAFPPENVARAATLSYHGGKNEMPKWVKPGWYRKVYELDFISAYSWSMTRLPPMTGGRFRRVREFPAGRDAIVCASGDTTCKYHCIRSHDFRPIEGRFEDTWLTGYEIESALRSRCLTLRNAWGYVWEPARGARNPFGEYADRFYADKSKYERGSVEYEFNKLLNNSLTGKLIQTTRLPGRVLADAAGSTEMSDEWEAGGLFNPVLASWVTGRVRARLHDMEEKYASLHSSTDSLKTFGPPDPADLGGLGGMKVECRGDCLILRPKLYIHLDERGKPVKWAMHGFQGTLRELRKAAQSYLRGEAYEYFVNHCWSAREVAHRSKPEHALDFTQKRLVLHPAGAAA